MPKVKFLTGDGRRYARASASQPQFVVTVGEVIDLDDQTLAQINSDRYEVVGDVTEKPVKTTKAAKKSRSKATSKGK